MFVVPSIILGYVGSIPALYFVLKFMFKGAQGVSVAPIPSTGATVKALVLGLVIPLLSSILPIQSSLNK
jgi:hypothetical protein